MDLAYYILFPFSLLLTWFYKLFGSYGIALILFALTVKLILFPFSLKGKRSMIQMNLLSGKMQKLQKMYGKNQQKYNEEVQKLYEKEGVNPMGGCLWSLVPMFILIPLYAIIRQPLKYMMGMTADQITAVAGALNWSAVALDNGWIRQAADFVNGGYNQLYLSSLITPENLAAVKAAAGEGAREIFSINFGFLGVDLAQIPKLKFWLDGLQGFGRFVIPVISAGTSVLFSVISMRTNQMNNQDTNAQAQSTNRTMMLISPLMSLWIGFSMPAALSIYWIANNLLGLAQEVISGKLLKKDYEQAAEAARQRAIEEKEEEKRLRREKAEQRAREAEEARKNKGKKKEKAEEDKMTPEQREASREGIRQYARGRAYDPDRFGGVTPYTDPFGAPEQTEEKTETEEAPAEPVEEVKAPVEEAPAEDIVEELQAQVDELVAEEETPAEADGESKDEE